MLFLITGYQLKQSHVGDKEGAKQFFSLQNDQGS